MSTMPVRYYERWITPILQQVIEDHPIMILTGARQVGKSTLLLNAAPFNQWRYLSMDDFDVLEQAEQDPESLWAGTDAIILDEVQKVPRLLSSIKQAVDRHPGRYRFVLSGSANLLLMRQVSETLAGRAVYLVLEPMTLGETQQKPAPDLLKNVLSGKWPAVEELSAYSVDPVPLILRGFMPPLLTLGSPNAWLRWWEGYVATYLERDLRQISQIVSLIDFRRVMELAALRTAQLLNQTELARDAQVPQPTVHRYLNLLETTYLFERIPSYTASRTARLVKSPKGYWSDAGLATYLGGVYQEEDLRRTRELGAFFETLVFHHLRVLARMMTPAARLYYWRTREGREVDFVLEYGQRLLAVEIKSAENPGYGDTAGLRAFIDQHPQAVGGLLLHTGERIKQLGKNIIAAPWTVVAT